MAEKTEHSVDSKTLLYLVGLVVVFYLIWKLSSLILLVVTALMLAAALIPVVECLSKYIPRTFSIIVVILGIFLPLVGVIVSIAPGLIRQVPEIVNNVNSAYNSADFLPESLRNINLSADAGLDGQGILRSTSRVTGIVVTIITLIFLTFYTLVDSKSLHDLLMAFVPGKDKTKVDNVLEIMSKVSGQYIRGNLIISLICGIVIFLGLLFLNVPFAAPLGIFAGLMDLLPLIGAIVGAIPAVILAFTVSPTIGFLVILLFVVYQQIENVILAPNIYNKALNLSAVISFLAVIIGASLFGIAGAFLALPIAASIPAIVKYLRESID